MPDLLGKRVLDIGCGRRYPWTLLLHGSGAHVTGIDLDYVSTSLGLRQLGIMAKRMGIRRALKRTAREVLERPFYWRALRRACGFRLKPAELDIRQMDATHLDFPDATFDLVVSNAVFEHIADVPGVAKEMRRALKPGGLAYLAVHLFPSLSGGHNVPRGIPGTDVLILGDVPPWDHLRDNRCPSKEYLNRLRESEYRAVFEKEFEILAWQTQFTEPAWVRQYLTPGVRAALAAYSEEELLKRSIAIVLRKSAGLGYQPAP